MTFLLRVDGPRWQRTVDAVLADRDDPGTGGRVVPVAKSNGYGLGQALLARQMGARGRPVLAVGTIYEALDPHLDWGADLLVLTPWQVAEPQALDAWQRARQRYGTMLITTIGDATSLRTIAEESITHPARPVRVVVEGQTSTKRFGFIQPELQAALRDPVVEQAMAAGALRLAGLALHLPIAPPQIAKTEPTRHLIDAPSTEPVVAGSGTVQQAVAWAQWWLAEVGRCGEATGGEADFSCAADLWVSHLGPEELRQTRAALPDVPVHPRIGTALWLGDVGSMQATGVVLAVHKADGGGAGYFQKRLPAGSHLAVVGGGTNHGVAMAGPIGAASVRRRASTAASGLLNAAGWVPSPFRWNGKRLRFLEAPHASVSLVIVPKGVRPPEVGAELDCQVRFSTSAFDQVVGLE